MFVINVGCILSVCIIARLHCDVIYWFNHTQLKHIPLFWLNILLFLYPLFVSSGTRICCSRSYLQTRPSSLYFQSFQTTTTPKLFVKPELKAQRYNLSNQAIVTASSLQIRSYSLLTGSCNVGTHNTGLLQRYVHLTSSQATHPHPALTLPIKLSKLRMLDSIL